MNNIAMTHAATISRDLKYHLTAQSFIWDWICDDEVRAVLGLAFSVQFVSRPAVAPQAENCGACCCNHCCRHGRDVWV